MRPRFSLVLPALSSVLLSLSVSPLLAATGGVEDAEALLESGRPAEAVERLDAILDDRDPDAEGLLLRSTAHFMLGDSEAGKRDLDAAIAADPGLRQAWLNRAAVAMAEERYADALDDLRKARDLDPDASDNDLNIGAANLLLGDLQKAAANFQRYLADNPSSGQAHYLVASNYAMAGYAALALRHLERAVALDERVRRRARTDPNFSDLAADPRYQRILDTDSYRPPPGARVAARRFDATYDGGRGPLLTATLDALQFLGEPYEQAVEVTPAWAVIWGDYRIEIRDGSEVGGVVELTAPPGTIGEAEWERRIKRLFDSIFVQLQRRR